MADRGRPRAGDGGARGPHPAGLHDAALPRAVRAVPGDRRAGRGALVGADRPAGAGRRRLVAGVGMGVAAAQWLPLFELGRMSYRGPGLGYDLAATWPLRWQNLATVMLPYLFRLPDGRWVTLWQQWESLPVRRDCAARAGDGRGAARDAADRAVLPAAGGAWRCWSGWPTRARRQHPSAALGAARVLVAAGARAATPT